METEIMAFSVNDHFAEIWICEGKKNKLVLFLSVCVFLSLAILSAVWQERQLPAQADANILSAVLMVAMGLEAFGAIGTQGHAL